MQEFYPLTQTQSGILVDSLSHPDTTIYNVPFLYRLSDKLDLVRLKKAIEEAVAAHPYLNATLATDADGNFRVRRNDGAEPQAELIEAGKLPEDLVKPFDLIGGRLYRLQIFKTDDGSYLFLDFHHILYDGTSCVILMKDINTAYGGGSITPETYTGGRKGRL